MLDLWAAAMLARNRITERLAAATRNEKSAMSVSARIIEEGASFRTHLLDVLRRSGDERTSPSLPLRWLIERAEEFNESGLVYRAELIESDAAGCPLKRAGNAERIRFGGGGHRRDNHRADVMSQFIRRDYKAGARF